MIRAVLSDLQWTRVVREKGAAVFPDGFSPFWGCLRRLRSGFWMGCRDIRIELERMEPGFVYDIRVKSIGIDGVNL